MTQTQSQSRWPRDIHDAFNKQIDIAHTLFTKETVDGMVRNSLWVAKGNPENRYPHRALNNFRDSIRQKCLEAFDQHQDGLLKQPEVTATPPETDVVRSKARKTTRKKARKSTARKKTTARKSTVRKEATSEDK